MSDERRKQIEDRRQFIEKMIPYYEREKHDAETRIRELEDEDNALWLELAAILAKEPHD